jgi:leader peptidase (prepilin peptidase) / N-methyltransferase
LDGHDGPGRDNAARAAGTGLREELVDIISNVLSRENWPAVGSPFWVVVLFVLGSMVGSFLNVCIYRMPRDMSVIRPRSHCPKCGYAIPWFLNVPLLTWISLRGKCKNCAEPISVRYVLVELFTGLTFATAWALIAPRSVGLAIVYCVILAAFIVATLIDFEHFIIPDEITIGGIVAGFVFSAVVPQLHNTLSRADALRASFWGIVVGGGLVYAILRAGKMAFGKEKLQLAPESNITFTETSLKLPDKELPYDEIFYRKTDYVRLLAKTVEVRFAEGSEQSDRCYFNVVITLTPDALKIGEDTFNPEQIPNMEVLTSELVLPREAMGFGDVKFMAAIGAFLGWQAAIFALMFSAVIGTIVSLGAIVIRRAEWTSRIPYGPYIALAAVIYMFLPVAQQEMWKNYLSVFTQILPWGDKRPLF